MTQENIAPEHSFNPTLAGTHPGSLASGEACGFLAFVGASFLARQGLDQGKIRYSVRQEGVTSSVQSLRWSSHFVGQYGQIIDVKKQMQALTIGRTGSDHRTNATPRYQKNRIGSSKRS